MRPTSRTSRDVRRVLYACAVGLLLVAGCRDDSADDQPGSARPPTDRSAGSTADRGSRSGEPLPATMIRFTDMTEQAGIQFEYRNGEEAGNLAILESLGGGAALFDFDGDGDLDLFLPGGGGFATGPQVLGRPPALYVNQGGWNFIEASVPAGLDRAPFYSHGASAADFDNDGFTDLLVTGYGGLLLFHNRGDGTFEERAAPAGLTDRLWSSSAAWGDVNGDGDLDLYVAHYVDWSFENHPHCAGPKPGQREVCPPREFQPLPDVLYVNNGDGTFRDASLEAGLRLEGPETGKGLGVLMADLDLDGAIDIYVGNDTVPNFLYRNQGDGRFEDVSLTSGTSMNDRGVADGSMGVDSGDLNLDGRPDLWVANYENESFAYYRNEGRCEFYHSSQAAGITAVGGLYVGWGTVIFDADRDGDEDIFASNGHVIRFPVNAPLRQTPLMFENLEGRRFRNVAPAAGAYLASPHMGRGAAVGDIDNDGRLDLAVSHTNEPAALLKNESADANGWIGFRLIGTRSNRDAIGAVVRLRTAQGTQVRQIKGGTSYASTCDLRVHFGIGRQDAVEQAAIRWPSGHEQVVKAPAIGQYHTVVEP
ncbi:MAG TPA: CRTAC1 family protein [Planctomycetaceae bacterium]|nr:CRTAC1 family protein [Planctomycetaceae bacterium]